MSTVNISLPIEQINFLDKLVVLYGFASRSEFIRSVLRLITRKPEIIEEASTFPFIVPREKSIKKIMSNFKKTKRYSPAFLKDLENGLKSSDYFRE